MQTKPSLVWPYYFALFWVSVLIFVLPIAGTATFRTLGLLLPLAVLIWRNWSLRDIQWLRAGYEWPFFLFLLAGIASLPTSIDFRESLGEIKGELIVPILLFYVIYLTVRGEKEAKFLLKALFCGTLVFNVYSFYDFYRHHGDWFTPVYRAGGLRDPGGGEAAAVYHTMLFPFLLFGAIYASRNWQKVIMIVLMFMNLLALHITFTRAAYVAIACQLLAIALILLLDRRWLLATGLLVFICATGVVYKHNNMLREVHTQKVLTITEFMAMTPQQIAGPNPTSMQQRLAMWKTALDKITEKPFYPHGYGRFLFGPAVRTQDNKIFIHKQTHNTFIGTAFELGIQGLLVFLWMIGTFFWVCCKYLRRAATPFGRYFAASLLVMMVGYWVNNFFGSFDGDDSKLLFMTLLGIGMAVMHRIPHFSTQSGGAVE